MVGTSIMPQLSWQDYLTPDEFVEGSKDLHNGIRDIAVVAAVSHPALRWLDPE